jgi:trimeric autotransporter adhesin
MKKKLSILLLFFTYCFHSQVGINTTIPNAQLEIAASNQATPTNTDGIIIPKIDAFPVTNPTASQQSMLVYLTTTSAGKQPGFYYWDNTTTSWIGINSSINGDTDWLKIPGGTTPNYTDDMHHNGRAVVGTFLSPTKTFSVNGTGIYNQVTGASEGIYNYVDGSIGGNVFANYTRLYGNGSGGAQVGNYIKVESTNNTAEHDGIWIDMTNVNTNSNNRFGIRTEISGTATGAPSHVGLSNNIQSNTLGTKVGMQNSIGGNGQNFGVQNVFTSGTNATAIYNRFLSTIPGNGLFSLFESTSSGIQYGMYNGFSGASTNSNYGAYNLFQSGSGIEYGTYNDIQNNTNSVKYGTYNRFVSSGNGTKYGTYNDFSGTISFPLYGTYTNINTASSNQAIYGNYFNMTVTGNTSTLRTANFNSISGSGTGTVMGMFNNISYSGTGFKVGLENSFSGNSTGSTSGIRNTFTGQASDFYGLFNFFNTSGTTTQYGIMNASNGTNSGTQYGVYNNFNNAASGLVTGIHNVIDRNSSSNLYGINNDLRPNGTGNSYGTHTQFSGSGSGNWYAHYSDIPNGGVGNKYGFYSLIRTGSGGQHYGIYSEALKSGAFAGYFLGNVSIGTTTGNNYILPASRGTNGQTMQTDGSGNVSWVDPSLRNYATTGASTGIYNVSLSEYTIRVYNGISEIRLPNAVGNQGKIFIIIGSNGISSKIFSTSGGFIYDDVTNSNISTINPNERFTVQSDGTDWIVIN